MTDRIVRIDTYRWDAHAHVLFVELTTASGLVGLGEGWGIPTAVEAVIHDFAAPIVVANGADPRQRETLWNAWFSIANIWNYSGAEMRAISALDVALWDLNGKELGRPVYDLLGGRFRDHIHAYNTCVDAGGFEDGSRVFTDPAGLAQELLDDGFNAMKIWPFDQFAPNVLSPLARTHGGPGPYISSAQIHAGVEPIAAIRAAVGDRMDVMIEGHHRWDVNSAIRIARALEPYYPMWLEDMTLSDNAGDLARLVRETRVPILASERLMTRYAFRDVLEAGGAHHVMIDISFVGGLTEAQKVATMASAYNLPITTHDCNGPVTCLANLHFSIATPNASTTETVRGFYDGGWYTEVLEDRLPIGNGRADAFDRPGLGTQLQDEWKQRPDVHRRTTVL